MERNEQSQSPLFGKLPGEIRNRIFELALTQYESTDEAYKPDAYYKRPGHNGRIRLHTALLCTCRKIFAEARHLPAQTAMLHLWFEGSERRPPHCDNGYYNRSIEFYNFAGCRTAQVFAQSFWLEGFGLNKWFSPLPRDRKLSKIYRMEQLAELTVTIRHTDWWDWEHNAPLRIQERWIAGFKAPKTLKSFNLELEVPQRKKNELDSIINFLVKDWTFKREDDVVFATKHNEPVVTTWTGSAVFDGVNREPVSPGGTEGGQPLGQEVKPGETADEQTSTQGVQPQTIDYHIVRLTWTPVT